MSFPLCALPGCTNTAQDRLAMTCCITSIYKNIGRKDTIAPVLPIKTLFRQLYINLLGYNCSMLVVITYNCLLILFLTVSLKPLIKLSLNKFVILCQSSCFNFLCIFVIYLFKVRSIFNISVFILNSLESCHICA